MSERKKPVLAVGWGLAEGEYYIFELGDPRRAWDRVSTDKSMVTGRQKDWDVVRSYPLEDVLDKIKDIYLSKYREDLLAHETDRAMNWIVMGWALKLGVRVEGKLFKAIPKNK